MTTSTSKQLSLTTIDTTNVERYMDTSEDHMLNIVRFYF